MSRVGESHTTLYAKLFCSVFLGYKLPCYMVHSNIICHSLLVHKAAFFLQPADAFVGSRPKPGEDGFLYHVTMTLTGPITEDQNTRGRKIYAPEESTQSFGILLSTEIPNVCCVFSHLISSLVVWCMERVAFM